MTITITKKAPKKHGSFDIASVGFHENGGHPYYEVGSTHPSKDGPYHVFLNSDRSRSSRCTCFDFTEYRVFLEDEERRCKHMIGIDHLLELIQQREKYEQEIAGYTAAIFCLLRLIESYKNHD